MNIIFRAAFSAVHDDPHAPPTPHPTTTPTSAPPATPPPPPTPLAQRAPTLLKRTPALEPARPSSSQFKRKRISRTLSAPPVPPAPTAALRDGSWRPPSQSSQLPRQRISALRIVPQIRRAALSFSFSVPEPTLTYWVLRSLTAHRRPSFTSSWSSPSSVTRNGQPAASSLRTRTSSRAATVHGPRTPGTAWPECIRGPCATVSGSCEDGYCCSCYD